MEYGLIGEKLGHSYSKQIHEMFGRYGYELRELRPEELEGFAKSKAFKGINVTIPYKEQIIPFLDELDEGAEKIGAVNTVVNRGGRLYGYNTDFYGMISVLKDMGFDFAGKSVLILGSGGTSKTAAAAAASLGATETVRVSRTGKDGMITYEEALKRAEEFEFLINTTPCGMYPNTEAAPIDLSPFKRLFGVFDAIFNPGRTRLLQQAEAQGLRTAGGLKMLVFQAAAAAELFTGSPLEEGLADKVYGVLRAERENIVLLGMPGCGKSTIGKSLAAMLDRRFIDTDSEIVKREGREITEIFAVEGEAYFRKVESEVIAECSVGGGNIISTGGGAVLYSSNVEALRRYGRLFFLDRSLSRLVPTDDRPLADNLQKMEKLYKDRLPIYTAVADVRICADHEVDEVTRDIAAYYLK